MTHERDSRHVVVRLNDGDAAERDNALALATSRGLLEFYDLEANLVSPSLDENHRPVAHDSLYDLLVGRQSPAREDDVESWYLFDTNHRPVAGPTAVKSLLLPTGSLQPGWRILGVPPKTVVLECRIGEVVCPGVGVLEPQSDFYYLIRHDPPRAPELDGDDLFPDGARQDVDSTTGEPTVTMRFTVEGAAAFGELTAREARRGRESHVRGAFAGDTFQHFAIVLDREIKSWPSIDWEQYPNGITGEHGAQITGIGSLKEAKDLAVVLQSGALPVRFEVVERPA